MEIKRVPRRRAQQQDEEEARPLRPGAPGLSYYCEACSAWRVTLDCQVCGAELDDAVVDEGGRAHLSEGGALLSPSVKAWSRALGREILPSLPGGLICGFLAWTALLPELPFTSPDRTWPGQLLATFVCSYWLLERTRASYQKGVDLDANEAAISLLRALLVFPLLAGVASGHWAGLPVALVTAPLAPLLLGALVSGDVREFAPSNLWSAFRATAGYLRLALASALGIGVGMTALWQYPEANSALRALIATLGVTLAGSVVGIGRRGAEHVPEE